MRTILTYEEINQEQWKKLITKSSTGTWFQTPEAYAFFASMPDLFQPFVVGIEKEPTSDSSLKGRESFASVWGAHTADSTQYDLLKETACANRKKPTEAESILWGMLKGNNLGLHFRRQHIILDYIVDFICLEKGLIIELDGGYHTNPQQKEYDEQRTAHLQRLGYTELRFTNEELLVDPESVVAKIKARATQLPSFQGGDGGRPLLRAICVGYVTKEKNAVKQFFTRRAIIIGGPALADDATEEEVIALMTAIREQPILNPSLKGRTSNHPSLQGRDGKRLLSPIYIETRNLNDYSRWKEAFEKAGFDYMPHLNFHIDPRVDNLSENRHRQVRQSNAEIEIIENKNIQNTAYADINTAKKNTIREWYEILRELYRTKVKTPLWPEEFFLEAYRQGVGTFMMVKHNNRVIGGSMLVMGKEGTTYEWYACGQNRVYKDQHPSVMATWAGIQWAKEQGYTRYDMMGAGKPDEEYGVRDFKAEFGGEKVEHGRFVCVQHPLLYKLGTWAVSILKG